MSRKSKVTVIVVGGITALLTGGIVALSQPPVPPVPPAGGLGYKVAQRGLEIVRGRVVAKDKQRQAVKVEGAPSWGPGELGPSPMPAPAIWVAFRPHTMVRRATEVGVGEVRLGDEILVQGLPSAIDARRIVIGNLPEVAPEEEPPGPFASLPPVSPPPGEVGAPVPPPMEKFPGPVVAGMGLRGGLPFASARGKVVDLLPLTIECQIPIPPPAPTALPEPGVPPPMPEPKTVKIRINADENARVMKVVDSSFEEIRMGEEVVAAGRAERRGALLARLVIVGAQTEELLPHFGGVGGPGMMEGQFKFGGERPWAGEPREEGM